MNRRHFLGSLTSALAALPVMSHARGPAWPDAPDGMGVVRELLIQESPVAGFQYHDGEAAWSRLAVGDSLRLRREPENPHDRQAVAVYRDDSKLGYVPRAANTAVSQMMDRGERLSARIEHLRESRNPWSRVGISIAARIAG